ncbi:hypothetical protein Tco_1157073 [Tanacetum coccineum]
MVDLLQDNLALGERLDKHGTRLYNLEKLDIPHKVSQAVDEIVTDAVDWAMQAPLRARFRDLPTVDMKEILQQRMFEETIITKVIMITKDLCEGPAEVLLAHFGAPGTSGALGSSQLLPPPPPPLTGTSRSTPQQGLEALRAQSFLLQMIRCLMTLPPDEQNNWASALASSYEPPAENSLLAQDWRHDDFLIGYCLYHSPSVLDGGVSQDTYRFRLLGKSGRKIKSESNAIRPMHLGGPHMKATRYPDFSLKLLVPEHMWIEDVCTYNISAKYGIAHWSSMMALLTSIPETLVFTESSYGIQDQAAQSGYEYRFWTKKDVTRSKEFITAIERRLKTRRIYPNLECFIGGRVRDIDYRLL